MTNTNVRVWTFLYHYSRPFLSESIGPVRLNVCECSRFGAMNKRNRQESAWNRVVYRLTRFNFLSIIENLNPNGHSGYHGWKVQHGVAFPCEIYAPVYGLSYLPSGLVHTIDSLSYDDLVDAGNGVGLCESMYARSLCHDSIERSQGECQK